jgi:hypothetical protein
LTNQVATLEEFFPKLLLLERLRIEQRAISESRLFVKRATGGQAFVAHLLEVFTGAPTIGTCEKSMEQFHVGLPSLRL